MHFLRLPTTLHVNNFHQISHESYSDSDTSNGDTNEALINVMLDCLKMCIITTQSFLPMAPIFQPDPQSLMLSQSAALVAGLQDCPMPYGAGWMEAGWRYTIEIGMIVAKL